MIRIFLGLVGSGKTANCVREMFINPSRKMTFSNIQTKHIKNNTIIKAEMIVKKELIKTKKNGEEVYKYSLNDEFWKKTVKKHKSINVILDESHNFIDSRRSMTTTNKIMNDLLSLLRRVIGEDEAGYGQLTFITQIERRLDIVAKEMATNIKYHKCFYIKQCKKCNWYIEENNEIPNPIFRCGSCGSYKILKKDHYLEIWEFDNMDKYVQWKYFGRKYDNIGKKLYWARYIINDIEKYFPYYNTLQWDNLLSELY